MLWIAFAICFLGNWSPLGAVLGTLAFGLADSISIYIQAIGTSGNVPRELVIALPYILTIVLTIFRKNFNNVFLIKEDFTMKIAVICANGKAGQLIVKEAVNRGLDVTAVVRG